MVKNPFELRRFRLDGMMTLGATLKESLKQPYIGFTQGGSSRKDKGARVAATKSEVKQPQGNKT